MKPAVKWEGHWCAEAGVGGRCSPVLSGSGDLGLMLAPSVHCAALTNRTVLMYMGTGQTLTGPYTGV